MTISNEETREKVKKNGWEQSKRWDDGVEKKEKLEEKPKKRPCISCPICYNEFNEIDGSEPVILTCGHSICCKCVISIVEVASKRCDVRCPLDRITVEGGFLPFNLDVIAYNTR